MLGRYAVSDIETYKECFDVGFYFPEENKWYEFQICKYRNDLYKFVKFWAEEKIDYLVFFNGINFDQQVIEWIMRNYQDWHDLSNLEIANLIHEEANLVIEKSHYKVRQRYAEENFSIPQLDLFKIWHFDREQRSTGLKKLEFSMDFPNIEELPIPPTKEGLTIEEIDDIVLYRRNDVMATYEHLQYTLGNTEHSVYKGDNKIEMRMTLKDEFSLSSLNISDSKIGDEIIRREYCRAAGISERELPRRGFFRKSVSVAWCIPKYIKFQTPQLQGFVEKIKEQKIGMREDFAEVIKFKDQVYDFKKGGIHNRISGRYYSSSEEEAIIDIDVTGYYPRIMLNNEFAPFHLKKGPFIKALQTIVDRREELKPQAKKDKRIKGVVGGLKIAANSVYGKTSDIHSWMYDRLVTLQTCITGELSLLMLIESLELADIPVIMANTDGITVKIKRTKLEEMRGITKAWEELTQYKLEETEFEFIAFSTVNDYLGLKKGTESIEERVKVKGDFLKDSELHGDKSRKIVKIALWEYFINGTDIRDTITNHKNIYDFCIGVKSSRNYHYELVTRGRSKNRRFIKDLDRMTFLTERGWIATRKGWKTQQMIDLEYYREDEGLTLEDAFWSEIEKEELHMNERDVLKKMVRYYISKQGKTIIKVKNPDSDAPGNQETLCESSSRVGGFYNPVVTYFNQYKEAEDYNIDYNYYLLQTDNILRKIEGRTKKIVNNPNQLSIF